VSIGITGGYTISVTKKTAISLPDDLYREIERARKRSKQDRSTWLQEAAGEYLKKTKEDEIEAYFSAYERVPYTADELALQKWEEAHYAELFGHIDSPAVARPARRRRAR
jgi:metal-responsive CopG/Arc/MetJ family transcriptional regulator